MIKSKFDPLTCRLQTSRSANAKTKKTEQTVDSIADDSEDAATNITIIQVSSTAVKENISIPITHESQNDDSESYTNNVQIIPSNFTASNTIDQNTITTVEVTSDKTKLSSASLSSTLSTITTTEQITTLAQNLTTAKNILSTACCTVTAVTTSQTNAENTRKFAAVTNISVKDTPIAHQSINSQPEQQHYEQVFVTQTPTTTTIPNNIDTSIESHSIDNNSPSVNSQAEIHLNRIKLNSKIDVVIRSVSETINGPSTSTVTFSTPPANSNTFATNTVNTAVPSSSMAAAAIATAATTTTRTKEPNDKHRTNDAKRENEMISRKPVLTRGLTEAVIIRPSRKDKNMLFNRFNSKGMQVITFYQMRCCLKILKLNNF